MQFQAAAILARINFPICAAIAQARRRRKNAFTQFNAKQIVHVAAGRGLGGGYRPDAGAASGLRRKAKTTAPKAHRPAMMNRMAS